MTSRLNFILRLLSSSDDGSASYLYEKRHGAMCKCKRDSLLSSPLVKTKSVNPF